MRRIQLDSKFSRFLYVSIACLTSFVGVIILLKSNPYLIQKVAAVSQKTNGKKGNMVSNQTKAIKANLIVLDPGHGGHDNGTSYGDMKEKDINLDIALKVQNLLKKNGYTVYMTRTDDTGSNLYTRVPIISDLNPSCVISIHTNYVRQTIVHGIETYCDYNDAKSYQLASALQSSVIAKTDAKDRKVQKKDYYLLRQLSMPSALIEVGFLSNDTERMNLQNEDYKDRIAAGIADGIMNFMPKNNEYKGR